ncbi:MAG TPA: hypothetical protein VNA15_00325 [Candidatus Angelobacter sp.]|nr:hypothetical protein [Candidatus Angelobacter sp.]
MATVSPAFARSVAYTYTLADLGQGGWGGGPLFTDGQAGGANGISFANGADVGTFTASTWKAGTSAITNGPGVDICGTLTVTKSDGTSTGLPPPGVYPGFCLSNVIHTNFPITGTPVVIFGTVVRVTPVG